MIINGPYSQGKEPKRPKSVAVPVQPSVPNVPQYQVIPTPGVQQTVPTSPFMEQPSQERWQPTRLEDTTTLTHRYGSAEPTPSLPIEEIALQKAKEYYPFLPDNDPELERRTKQFLEELIKNS